MEPRQERRREVKAASKKTRVNHDDPVEADIVNFEQKGKGRSSGKKKSNLNDQ